MWLGTRVIFATSELSVTLHLPTPDDQVNLIYTPIYHDDCSVLQDIATGEPYS